MRGYELIDALYEDAKKTKSCGSPTRRTIDLMRMAAAEISKQEEEIHRVKHENANLVRQIQRMQVEMCGMAKEMDHLDAFRSQAVAKLDSVAFAIRAARDEIAKKEA